MEGFKGKISFRRNLLIFVVGVVLVAMPLLYVYINKHKTNKAYGGTASTTLTTKADWTAGSNINTNLNNPLPDGGDVEINSVGEAAVGLKTIYDNDPTSVTASDDVSGKGNAVDQNSGTYWGGYAANYPYWIMDIGSSVVASKVSAEIFSAVPARITISNSTITCSNSYEGCSGTDIGDASYGFPNLSFSPTNVRYISAQFVDDAALTEIELYTPNGSATHTSGASQIDGGVNFISWTTLDSTATIPNNTSIDYRFRTSPDASTWSDWSDPVAYSSSTDLSGLTQSRYLQIETTLENSDSASSPALSSYTANSTNSDSIWGPYCTYDDGFICDALDCLPAIQLTSPVSTGEYSIGENLRIAWHVKESCPGALGGGEWIRYKVEVSTNNGSSYSTIAEDIPDVNFPTHQAWIDIISQANWYNLIQDTQIFYKVPDSYAVTGAKFRISMTIYEDHENPYGYSGDAERYSDQITFGISDINVPKILNLQLPSEATISLGCTSTVTMNSITGTGASTIDDNNRATCLVRTNNSVGYKLEWAASNVNMLSGTDQIGPYTPGSTDVPEVWGIASNTSEWGGHLGSASDVKDTTTWGTADSYSGGKWLNIATSPFQIITSSSQTGYPGDNEYIYFGAEIGTSKLQPTGTYSGSVTITATTL